MTTDRLAALLDPENAPARHGEWRPAHRPMGRESVELVDDDGCSLWVEPWEIAVLVNDAVDRAAGVTAPALDVERLREAAQAILDRCLDVFDPDDLDPESSFAMPVTLKARWVYALRAALTGEEKP